MNLTDRGDADHPAYLLWLPMALVLVTMAAWGNAVGGGWIFDDEVYLLRNPDVQHLWPPYFLMGNTRPVLFLTFALNWAAFGDNPAGFLLTNIVIHVFGVLLLYALVRDLWQRSGRELRTASLLAAGTALLWGLHPLHTTAVSYVWQRGESLASVLGMLSLWLFVRGCADDQRPTRWRLGAVAALAAGLLCKEIVAGVPLVALLIDRAFFAGSFSEAWRQRRGTWLGFAACWGLLAVVVVLFRDRFHNHPGIGLGEDGLSRWVLYLMTMPEVLMHYLRLTVWPDPLVLDYGWPLQRDWMKALLPGMVVLTGLGATLRGVWLNRRWAPAAAGVFLILAPTSSLMPMPDPLFEYRMYLPLAGLAVLVLAGLEWLHGRLAKQARRVELVMAGGIVGCALVLGVLTHLRNQAFASPELIWLDARTKRPENARALVNLGRYMGSRGAALGDPVLLHAALHEIDTGLVLNPDDANAHVVRATVLLCLGRLQEAEASLQEALRLEPKPASAHLLLGGLLLDRGEFEEALGHVDRAAAIDGSDAETYAIRGRVLTALNRLEEAAVAFQQALRRKPDLTAALEGLRDLQQRKAAGAQPTPEPLQDASPEQKLQQGFRQEREGSQ